MCFTISLFHMSIVYVSNQEPILRSEPHLGKLKPYWEILRFNSSDDRDKHTSLQHRGIR